MLFSGVSSGFSVFFLFLEPCPYTELLLCLNKSVNVWVCVCGQLGIPSSQYSWLTLIVPGISSSSTENLTRIKQSVKVSKTLGYFHFWKKQTLNARTLYMIEKHIMIKYVNLQTVTMWSVFPTLPEIKTRQIEGRHGSSRLGDDLL